MYVIAVPDDPAASYIVARSSLWDVGSPRALALARQDIDRCVHGHERCKTSFSPNLPSRVVDCTDLARPRLLSSAGECGEYLALSYVWGGDQIHKTTKSNLSAYEQGIAPSLLPATIRDAIYVTNKLGFRWLWVDSLCIVQDSDEDKLHELSHMHDIYRYSHVTILASSAEGAGSGFLQARSPYGGFALPFICPPSPPDPVGVQDDHSELQELQVGQVYLIPGHHGLYTEELACTGTRAWCMQEYILSPRTLVFTPDTLVFRCLTEGFVGVGHSVYMMFGEPKVPESLFLPPAASAPLELDSPEWKKIHVSWTEVVRDYTTRAASFESDKLLACAAVAEAFHRVLGAEYIAGLWRSDSLLFIHWEAERSDMTRSLGCRHTRPTNYRAPSWSWAAIEGPIEYPYPLNARINMPETIRLAEVAECWVTLEDPALPFGRVTDGALVLRGTLIPCRGEIAKFNEDKGHWSVALPSFKPIRRQWQLSLSRGLISDEEMDVYMTKPSDCATVIMDCDVDELPARMWFVPVARSPPTWYDEDHFLFNGIALELAPRSIGSGSEPEEIRFRRIGAFYIRVEVPRPGKDFTEHPVWDRLARAVMDGEPPWTGIVIV